MKKLFLFIVSAFIMIGALRAQETSSRDSIKFSHWSVAVNVGANMVDADMLQEFNQIIPNALVKPTIGGSIEYTFNPRFGLGLNYIYLPLASTYEDTYKYWRTEMHHASLYLSINLLNLFYRNINTKWNIYFNIGGGLAFYDATYHDHKDTDPIVELTEGRAATFPLGLNFEYNISKSIAIGFDYKFIGHNKDNIEGDPQGYRGTTNDFVHTATIGLRWKIGAQNKPHVRNINMAYFEGCCGGDGDLAKEAMQTAKEAKEAALEAQLTADDLKGRVGVLENRVDRIEPQVNYLSQLLADGPDADGDGVPDHRDREPNTPPNTVVDFWGRTVFTVGETAEPTAVFFDFDKVNLDAEAQQTIRNIAARLKADETLLVEIRGYADYIGDVQYNLGLSQRRADRVKDELVKVHGISSDRIVANGKGRIIEPRAKYRYNRRCDFFFSR
jgi:outer membrane protein OmpA-like peptidoglycan-associated protein/opacity protein-like surface antigen